MMRNEPTASAFSGREPPCDGTGTSIRAGTGLRRQRAREARAACDSLARELARHGLHTAPLRPDLLLALNPLVVCGRTASLIRKPGLKQLITCRPLDADTGRLWFWWVWSVAPDHTPMDTDPLCPASDIATAAVRVVKVLAVHDDAFGAGP